MVMVLRDGEYDASTLKYPCWLVVGHGLDVSTRLPEGNHRVFESLGTCQVALALPHWLCTVICRLSDARR